MMPRCSNAASAESNLKKHKVLEVIYLKLILAIVKTTLTRCKKGKSGLQRGCFCEWLNKFTRHGLSTKWVIIIEV